RQMRVSKLSAGILMGMYFYARYLGFVLFKFRNNKCCFENSTFYKWYSVIWRLMVLYCYLHLYTLWILKRGHAMNILVHFCYMAITVCCCSGIFYLQIFHSQKLIKLVNEYLHIFNQINRKIKGFGGKRELFFIILTAGCLIQETVIMLKILIEIDFSWKAVTFLINYTYITIASRLILRISVTWYLSLAVLYSKINKTLQFGLNTRKLRKTLKMLVDISLVTLSIQRILNIHLFLSLMHTFSYMIVTSFRMIVALDFKEVTYWIFCAKIILDLLLLSVAVQEATDHFSCIRETIACVHSSGTHKETVEIFLTFMRLHKFRVRVLGLFDISNKLFLEMASALFAYLLFIMQVAIDIHSK
ncbi:hypothetical protein KR018_008001, partial [Drosophila ironensis]